MNIGPNQPQASRHSSSRRRDATASKTIGYTNVPTIALKLFGLLSLQACLSACGDSTLQCISGPCSPGSICVYARDHMETWVEVSSVKDDPGYRVQIPQGMAGVLPVVRITRHEEGNRLVRGNPPDGKQARRTMSGFSKHIERFKDDWS